MKLGPLGVWTFPDLLPAREAAEFAQQVEALGYSALWIPEAVGREPIASSAWLLANTSKLILATGIASIHARDAMASSAGQKTLAEQSGGRFLLGLGVSHRPFVEGVRGHEYGKPLDQMRTYLDRMAKAPFAAALPKDPPPIVIGALHPGMLRLAAERTQGAHPYLMPPEHTAFAREVMGEGPWLCPEQKVLLVKDPSVARERARAALSIYLTLPNYLRSLRRFGFTDEDFGQGGSNRLVDAIVAWGDEKAIAERIRAHHHAGADHVCIQPLHPDGLPLPDLNVLRAMAPGAT